MGSINWKSFFDLAVDIAPFVIYGALMVKLYRSWRRIDQLADVVRKHTLVPVVMIMALVIGCALASNVYALVAYGKTFMSIRVFQLFLVANCVVYWLLIDILTKNAVVEEGTLRESTD